MTYIEIQEPHDLHLAMDKMLCSGNFIIVINLVLKKNILK